VKLAKKVCEPQRPAYLIVGALTSIAWIAFIPTYGCVPRANTSLPFCAHSPDLMVVTFLLFSVAVPNWHLGNGRQSWIAFPAYYDPPFRFLFPCKAIADSDAHGPL
jgi:hypothetical protein